MTGEPAPTTPDQPSAPPLPEGAGLPPNPDPAAEAKRREIERQVYERRTETDKQAESALDKPAAPLGKV